MAKFRKKPVVIEAFQAVRYLHTEWPPWFQEAYTKGDVPRPGAAWIDKEDPERRLVIGTLEGNHLVNWGDWIIRGIAGELYPCKPGIFEMTYEPVEE